MSDTFNGLDSFTANYEYGSWNTPTDSTLISTSIRRTDAIKQVNQALKVAYNKDCLAGVKHFYGIVLHQADRLHPSAEKKSSQSNASGADSPNMWQAYKVYIPELECRPLPESLEDSVLATYQDVRAAEGLLMSVGVGAIVKIRYDDPERLYGPAIIGVEGSVSSEFIPAVRSGLASSYSGGSKNVLPVTAGQRALLIGDSMTQSELSFGGRVATHMAKMGLELRGKIQRDEGSGDPVMPAGVYSAPGRGTAWFLQRDKLQKILSGAPGPKGEALSNKPELLIVGLGANDAGGALPKGAYYIGARCRQNAVDAGSPADIPKDAPIPDGKKSGHCRKQGQDLEPRKVAYQAKLKKFVEIARGAGVKRIIWIGPAYMSYIYGNVEFTVGSKYASAQTARTAKRDWGQSGLETGAINIRAWQKETFAELNVEWIDSVPITRNIPRGDGLHFRPGPGQGYELWANGIIKTIFGASAPAAGATT